MDDLISRQKTLDHLRKRLIQTANNNVGFVCDAGSTFEDASERVKTWLDEVPSIDAVQRTDDVLQRMQDIEQAQIEKAYDLGYAEGKADAVQVVRCKDCKYYKENTLACSRYGLEDDDYCSWAERKEETCNNNAE